MREHSASYRFIWRAIPILTVAAAVILSTGAHAFASKEPVDFFGGTGTEGGKFGGFSGNIAINNSGAGGVPVGTIYATDPGPFQPIVGPKANRVQRFVRDDNGTPANPTDDTYHFVAVWGAGVDSTVGGTNYQICTVAANCRDGIGQGGNGTLAGNGSFDNAFGIAVDQDTGNVYVVDVGERGNAGGFDGYGNFRINVYSATGTFLRSFGWDVDASTPGSEYEVCPASDVCKAGLPGSGLGQLGVAADIAISPPDGNPATGTVFLADAENRRVNTYNLDGTSPASFGSVALFSSMGSIAVDSRGIVYLSNSKNSNEIERYDTQNANGGGIGFLAPITSPPLASGSTAGLTVDPDSDGVGPDTDVLYAVRGGFTGFVQQFGPLNAPGFSAPPAAVDDTHGTTTGIYSSPSDIAVEPSVGNLYIAAHANSGSMGAGVFVLGTLGPPPTATLDSLSDVTTHSVTAHATIDPNGPPATRYHFEYSTDGSKWTSTPEVVLGIQEDPQTVEETIDPPPIGLESNRLYHVQLVAGRKLSAPIVTPELTATTLAAKPLVETTGSSVRSATTAQLQGRVAANGLATTYHFEYGTQGPCDANPCSATPDQPAGSGGQLKFVAEDLEGLEPNTAYHYRIVADNSAPGGPIAGEDVIVTTRASDAPLNHGHFPGPPGSDRAWEQVNLPDTGGNQVSAGFGFSDDGNRALYGIVGGTPIGDTGSLLSLYFAERPFGAHPQNGWQTKLVSPPRNQLAGVNWGNISARSDISLVFGRNTGGNFESAAVWRLSPDIQAANLFQTSPLIDLDSSFGYYGFSADGSRTVAVLDGGAPDPAYPAAGATLNLYDISSGTPELVSLLPGDIVPACGVQKPTGAFAMVNAQASHWISADGSLVFFPSRGDDCASSSKLYLRDMVAGQTKLIASAGNFIKSTPGAAFFATGQSLDPDDAGGNDVYRYDLADESLECVTCVIPGFAVKVEGSSHYEVAVSEDGSRVYFQTSTPLLAGAPPSGSPGLYRVDVASGALAYVAPFGLGQTIVSSNSSLSSDGSFLSFESDAAALNPIGGTDNGGTTQLYLYNDEDRSLSCVSCPQDGSKPPFSASILGGAERLGPNLRPLAEDGTVAFATPVALASTDQNTPPEEADPRRGTDAYEWRDGRQFLVTDGLTNWTPEEQPIVYGISPSGRDIYFRAAAQYTQDALDSYARLYDARIGGGMDFPVPPPPCPLEVCQGTPKGAPEEAPAGTSAFTGPGNRTTGFPVKCRKGKVRRRGRCVPKRHKGAKPAHKRANHDRRASR